MYLSGQFLQPWGIKMFGLMELDLPTPVSHPPSWKNHPRSCVACPQRNYICQFIKMDISEFSIKNSTIMTSTLSK